MSRLSKNIRDLQLRPRLKLPNSTDKKKWRSLDEEIYTRTVSTFSNVEWRRGRVADLLPRFTDIVYESAASKFGTVDSKAQANPAQGEHKRQPRLLRKLKLLRKLQGRNSDESREMVATSSKRMHSS